MRCTLRSGVLLAAILLGMTAPASSDDLKKIAIAMSSDSVSASAARIVREMGLFTKHGLDAAVTAMDSGNGATAALLSGSVNFATTSASDLVFVQARGQKVVALTSSYTGYASVLVLSKAAVEKAKVSETAPIEQRLKALDGLTIASSNATSTNTIVVTSSAASVGANVKWVYMSQPAMVAALQTGAIQGFIGAAPYYVQPVINGSGVIWITGPKGEFPPQFVPPYTTVVMATRDFATANPDVINRVTAAFTDLGKAVVERPQEVKAAIARLFPALDPKTLDLVFETDSRGLELRPVSLADIARIIDFVKLTATQPGIENVKAEALMFP